VRGEGKSSLIQQDVIDQIREKLDLVELVREYVPTLRKAGRAHKACCPFHQERTASFTVNQDKQLWYCFGACHEGGDAFKFVMKAENLNFSEAAQRLAERAGVPWQPAAESLGPRDKERLAVKDALEFAKDFYKRVLDSSSEAETARRYLAKRGLTKASLDKFELGFAPPQGGLLQAATKKGVAPSLLQKAGLVSEREGGVFRDYFRSRILFPIRDARGAVVGFGGRVHGDFEPKYLNTPETAVFTKGRTLYGLHQAGPSIRKENKAVIVEGYMDVVGCHQHGLTNAVAPLGTALTLDHAAMLKRYAEEALLVFDPDAAGSLASIRGAEILLEQGLFVRIGTVPDGQDPDDFLQAKGLKALQEALAKSADIAEFQTGLALRRTPVPSLTDKARIAREVLATISKQTNAVIRNEWFRRLAGDLGLGEEALREEEKKSKRATAPVRRAEEAAKQAPPPERVVERELIQLVLKHPDTFPAAGRLTVENFPTQRGRAAWKAVLEAEKAPGWPERLAQAPEDETAGWLLKLLMEDRAYDKPAESVELLVGDLIRTGKDEDRFRELEAAIKKQPAPPDVLREFMELARKLRGSKQG
jgi:DNA primase